MCRWFANVPAASAIRHAGAGALGSMLAGPSLFPEAHMLGGGPEVFNCMDCEFPSPPPRPNLPPRMAQLVPRCCRGALAIGRAAAARSSCVLWTRVCDGGCRACRCGLGEFDSPGALIGGQYQIGHDGGYSCPSGVSPSGVPYCQDSLSWDK